MSKFIDSFLDESSVYDYLEDADIDVEEDDEDEDLEESFDSLFEDTKEDDEEDDEDLEECLSFLEADEVDEDEDTKEDDEEAIEEAYNFIVNDTVSYSESFSEILAEANVVRLDKKTLKKRLYTQATLLAAKEKGDPLYQKYRKAAQKKKAFRQAIQDKYAAQGKKKLKEFLVAQKASK